MGGEGSTHFSETLEATTFVPIESRRFSRSDGVASAAAILKNCKTSYPISTKCQNEQK